MGTAFLILYVILLLVQVFFLFWNLKKPHPRWKPLYIIELVSLAAAAVLAVYYNNLPSSGFLGMTYMAEILFSMMAAAAYAVMFVISLIAHLISRWKNKT